MSQVVAALAALALAGFGLVRGTWAVGGSDSSCYALMADAFARGEWQPSSRLAIDAPWPDASRTFAPGGFIPSSLRPDAASPICAPGVAVLMAPLVAIAGRDALFVLSPLAGAVLVWCAFLLARRLAGDMAGAMAAVLVAASPIVLFQVVQPMNDIVTAALWLAALAVATKPATTRNVASGFSRTLGGFLTGLAILVRPNLVPLAAMVLAIVLLKIRSQEPGAERPVRITLFFLAGALPPIAVLLLLNQVLYGHIIGSGYESAAVLFSPGFILTNAVQLARRLYDTQTPFVLLALLAPFVLIDKVRAMAWALLASAGTVIACYLFYRPYPEWWYLRFQLLAVVLLIVLASAVAAHLAQRARMGGVIAIATVVLALYGMRVAGQRQVLELQRLEGRYRETAALVRDRLPANAVLITVWQSGSMRFHAGREAVLWDSLDPMWLDRAVAWLIDRGRAPYILMERREEGEFRDRFKTGSALGALDWPPRFDLGRQVRIFDPSDRPRYVAGESFATENIRRE